MAEGFVDYNIFSNIDWETSKSMFGKNLQSTNKGRQLKSMETTRMINQVLETVGIHVSVINPTYFIDEYYNNT